MDLPLLRQGHKAIRRKARGNKVHECVPHQVRIAKDWRILQAKVRGEGIQAGFYETQSETLPTKIERRAECLMILINCLYINKFYAIFKMDVQKLRRLMYKTNSQLKTKPFSIIDGNANTEYV